MNRYSTFLYFFILLLLAGCAGRNIINYFLKKQSDHESYQQALYKADLARTALGKDWIDEGENVLNDSLIVGLPFREVIYFPAEKIRAVSYRFQLKRGQVLKINTKINARLPVKVFSDLFEEDKKSKIIAFSDTAGQILYGVKKAGLYQLRVQPEMLRSCLVTITIESLPSLMFPVQGKAGSDIISIYGDARENGIRKHEGIDIIAKKGTPVLSATDGIVSNVKWNTKGGKVVYIFDVRTNHTFYYAHLDRQLVQLGQMIKAGEIIGIVGNTGNAVNTVSHLHFGIYDFKQALDPHPFVYKSLASFPPIIKEEMLNQWLRIKGTNAALLYSPELKSKVITHLKKHTLCKVTGGIDAWLRIILPNGKTGYVASKDIESLHKPLRYENINHRIPLYDEAYWNAVPKDSLNDKASVPVYAVFDYFEYVKNESGEYGWIVSKR